MSKESNIKAVFSYKTDPSVILMFEDDTLSIKSYVGSFEFKVKMIHGVTSAEKIKAAKNFLSNINGSLAISSFSQSTPKFVTGEINLPTIEIPVPEFTAYEFATFMYYKTQAILGSTMDVVEFRYNTTVPIEVEVDLDVDSLKVENPLIDEEAWMDGIREMLDSAGDSAEDIVVENPWWKRPTGELRDFFNNLDDLTDEELGNLVAYNIDLGVDMDAINEKTENLERDVSLARRILDDYNETGEIPRELLEEIQELAESLGFDLQEAIESISDGTMFGDYDDNEGTIRNSIMSTLEKTYNSKSDTKESQETNSNDSDDDDEPPKKGPTIVKL